MQKSLRFIVPLFLLLLVSCSTTGPKNSTSGYERTSNDPNVVEVNAAETGLDLTSYLRQVAGVQVKGSGESASILIRGVTSMQGSINPLIVIDGTPIGTNYAQAYNQIDVNNIKRVRVLKSASETAEYGIRGSNGVIEIELD